jgi:xanthine dehydrogenase accessory factor
MAGILDRVSDSLEPIRAWIGSGRRVAMATLVAARGTTPRREGAKMWVDEEGRVLGAVTIGGCVDARVLGESERVLEDGVARRLVLHLGEDDALDLGLTCGGVVEVLVESLRLADDDPVVGAYAGIARHVDRGGRAVILAHPEGGARRLVLRDDGRRAGTLGEASLDAAAVARAAELLDRPSGRVALVAGGDETVIFAERHAPPGTLLVVGAGHVAMALARLAAPLGLRATVIDARERYATRERFPDVHALLVGMPSELVAAQPIGAATAVVLVAHDYKFDLPVLRVVLETAAGYIGLLGSRRRGAAMLAALRDEGFEDERLARIRVPAGLDIGARSAEEIALSILAECIAAMRGRRGGPLRADAV